LNRQEVSIGINVALLIFGVPINRFCTISFLSTRDSGVVHVKLHRVTVSLRYSLIISWISSDLCIHYYPWNENNSLRLYIINKVYMLKILELDSTSQQFFLQEIKGGK